VIVLESSVVWASGGLPVALAVTIHDPSVEPATATDPLPVAMVLGAQAAPKQSPIEIVVAEAPDAHRSAPELRTIAVVKFLYISTLLKMKLLNLAHGAASRVPIWIVVL
jgi:hypothetical protein